MPRRFLASAVLAACVGAGASTSASGAGNLLPNGGFETGVSGWSATPSANARITARRGVARGGSSSLQIRVRRQGAAGAIAALPAGRLREEDLYGPVTGTLDATFSAVVWVRGRAGTAGKRVRVQLNEFGGVRPEEALPGATASVRVGTTWKPVAVAGKISRNDRIGVAVLAVLDRGRPGDVVYVDEVLVRGEPPERAPPATAADRWSWWVYALVWALVLATGAAWVVYARLAAGKTACAT